MLTYLFSFFLQPITGAFDSYYQLILRNSGYSQSMVGLIIGLSSIATVLIPFVAAFLTSKGASDKSTMLVCALIAAVSMIPAAFGAPVSVTIVTMFIAMGTRWAVAALSDGYINKQIGEDNAKYGVVRGIGTMGYVLAMTIWAFSGFPANNDNKQIIANICIAVSVFCFILILNPKGNRAEKKDGKFFDLKWFDRSFYLFFTIIGISRIAMAAIDKLLASYMTEVMGFGQYFTALVALGALSEFFMLVFGGRYADKHNVKPSSLLLLSFAGLTLRLLIYAGTSNLVMFLFAQLLHSCSFGACHLAANMYITKHVKEEHISMAFVMYWAVFQNLPQMIGVTAGGYLIDCLGYRGLFSVYALFPVISSILCIISIHKLNK